MTEMTVALGLLAFTLLPLSLAFFREQASLRALYQRAIAMEMVDGEMEVLRAGRWRAFAAGTHDYSVKAEAVRNLPAGRFILTVTSDRLRLEWQPEGRGHGGAVVREVAL
jgi:hypothetical protein